MASINKSKEDKYIYFLNIYTKNSVFVRYFLTNIYGIGISTAFSLCKKYDIYNKRISELKDIDKDNLLEGINKLKTGDSLKRQKIENIKRLIRINCYRGYRHHKFLPVRGQRTRTNANTRRKNKNLI